MVCIDGCFGGNSHFGRDRDVGGVDDPAAGKVWEDGILVIAVGRCHEPPAALGLKLVLAHQTADLLGLDDYPTMAQLGPNLSIAISLATIAVSSAADDDLS